MPHYHTMTKGHRKNYYKELSDASLERTSPEALSRFTTNVVTDSKPSIKLGKVFEHKSPPAQKQFNTFTNRSRSIGMNSRMIANSVQVS